MAQEHDLFDDIIEISKGFDFLKNPLGGVTDALDPSAPQWNPADYKERPRGNTIPCLTCKNEKSGCTACMDVCPVNAIEVEEDAIEILDSCRKCGLCAAACPTEAIISPRLAPKNLYDDIVSAGTSHETAYVTCTRALKRMPRENEVVVACVGDITAETCFSVLADYPNVSVYLPLGVCDKCRNTGGEDILGEAIAKAEEWAGTGMGLEVDPKSLKCHKRREYERKEYMEKIARTTGLTVTKLNPATAALASVTQKLKAHRHQITQLERTLNTMCGTTTTKRRRSLTHGRQLVLSTLQNHPELAQNMQVSTPECDFDKCTSCGECVNVCPTFACDLVGSGRFALESTYCLGCGACVKVCPEHALKLVKHDASNLVVVDPEAEEKAAQKAKAHEEAEKVKAEKGSDLKYLVGTMIEIPRAALTADEIAKEAEFFSFGTNDLTQMTFGFSRDDAGSFLPSYYEKQIFDNDPFERIDQIGVGKLVDMAVKLGRATRPDIHLGICGEHGGEPSSVEFCHRVGLDYVSCSPYRVPIARMAAAQAQIKNPRA